MEHNKNGRWVATCHDCRMPIEAWTKDEATARRRLESVRWKIDAVLDAGDDGAFGEPTRARMTADLCGPCAGKRREKNGKGKK